MKHYDRKKCAKCMFRGYGCGGQSGIITMKNGIERHQPIYCNVSGILGETCLTEVNGELIDRRGDYKHCRLYIKGNPPRIKEDIDVSEL